VLHAEHGKGKFKCIAVEAFLQLGLDDKEDVLRCAVSCRCWLAAAQRAALHRAKLTHPTGCVQAIMLCLLYIVRMVAFV
jgi:hypothetical protein